MLFVFEHIKALILSFELLVLLLGTALILNFPERVLNLSSIFSADSDFQKYAFLLPCALAGWVLLESKKLFFPEEDEKKILQAWPDYWKLKIHFRTALFYSILFAIIGLITWALGYKFIEPKGFILICVSVIGESVVAFSVYMARINQNEIFRQYKAN